MSDLLKDSIADAKAVREAALANAKSFLEEQFSQTMQSMFADKLSEEVDEESLDDIESDLDSVGNELDSVETNLNDIESELDVDSVDMSQPAPEGDPYMDDETSISSDELDEILSELSNEINEEDQVTDIDTPDMDVTDVTDVSQETPYGDIDTEIEDIDLNEILNELEQTSYSDLNEEDESSAEYDQVSEESTELDMDDLSESDDVSINEMATALVSINEENTKLKANLKKHIDTIHELKKVLNETNLLNAKLLYTNKLFKGKSLTESQKLKVIDTFDLTTSIREVKLAYSVLAESFNFGGSVVKRKKTSNTTAHRITEGLASKPVKSTKPNPIVEEKVDVMATRFQKLAGITK
jgi:hypothetical protein